MKLFQESLVQGALHPECFQKQFVRFFRVSDFKQRPQVPGVRGDAVMLEDFPGIMVSDIVVSIFPEWNAKAMLWLFNASASSASVVMFLLCHISKAFS